MNFGFVNVYKIQNCLWANTNLTMESKIKNGFKVETLQPTANEFTNFKEFISRIEKSNFAVKVNFHYHSNLDSIRYNSNVFYTEQK